MVKIVHVKGSGAEGEIIVIYERRHENYYIPHKIVWFKK